MTRRPAALTVTEQQERYLAAVRRFGTLSAGCRAAKCSPHTVYKWREDEDFGGREYETRNTFADRLEEEAYRRAYTGTLKPVYQGGREVGTIREFDTTLLVLLLKAVRPEKYRDRIDQNVNLGGNLRVTINYAPSVAPLPDRGETEREP